MSIQRDDDDEPEDHDADDQKCQCVLTFFKKAIKVDLDKQASATIATFRTNGVFVCEDGCTTKVEYKWSVSDALHPSDPPPAVIGPDTDKTFKVKVTKGARHEIDVNVEVKVLCDGVLCKHDSRIRKFTFDSDGALK